MGPAMSFPAITASYQNPLVWTWGRRVCRAPSFASFELSSIVPCGRCPSSILSSLEIRVRARLASVRASSRDSSMEGDSNAELLDAREPAHKKQACEVPHINGCSNGSNVKPVAHSLALRVKKLVPEAILPSRGSALAAGYDLSSAYDAIVPARGKALIKTGLSVAIPEGTYGRVAPRSGLAWKHSIDVGAGVIDADYRGPLGVILFNHSDVEFSIKAGDRIAQLILECIVTPEVLELDDLDETVRGEGGFGSTGVAAAAAVVIVDAPTGDAPMSTS
ncbi:hypothetical protein Mapa_000909 [Marchantia paleacea]|nr:hypothetical protein Mapa_000909 [Marchantia paleacea]